jgi:CitB family two-component system response regulator MalR/two-component system response regulator DctR
MVTSASDAQIVCQMVSRGIVDYLVKPFEYQRFREALDKFRQSHERWHTIDRALRQEDIDQMLSPNPPKTAPAQILAKGLNDSTMNMIRRFLMENGSSMFTSEEIAEKVHLSRITVRRYMSFMVETNEITSTIDYQTGGRPAIKYSYSQVK